jgi:ubiquinone/menaquinone biosynthesis C-methylase UbiE
VGSNCTYSADVNVDIDRSLPVDVVADLEHLPFKDGAFDVVTCFHTIEHVLDPQLALDELVRVSRKVVHAKVPWRFSWTAKYDPTHLPMFRSSWFKQHVELRVLSIACKVQLDLEHSPRIGLCFPFAYEILVHLWSKRRRMWHWKL